MYYALFQQLDYELVSRPGFPCLDALRTTGAQSLMRRRCTEAVTVSGEEDQRPRRVQSAVWKPRAALTPVDGGCGQPCLLPLGVWLTLCSSQMPLGCLSKAQSSIPFCLSDYSSQRGVSSPSLPLSLLTSLPPTDGREHGQPRGP